MTKKQSYFGKVIQNFTTPKQPVSALVKPYEFAAKIVVALNESFNEFVEVLMESLKEDFSIDRSAFFLVDTDKSWKLKAKIGYNLPDYDQSLSKEERFKILLVKDSVVSKPTEGVGFDLYMIFRDDNRNPIAVLAMDDTARPREFNPEELDLFRSLSVTINTLLKRKNIYDDLTIRDPLTGLYNRNVFRDIERDFANVDCMWTLDIDHFKKINDAYGHPAGDAVLRHLAKFLKQRLRQEDNTIVRHGGEEFVVIMKRINPEDGLERVKFLAKEFKTEHIQMPNGQLLCDVFP